MPNLLGVAGLGAIATSLGAIAGTWWVSMLVAGAEMVGLAYVGHIHLEAEHQPEPATEARVPRPRQQGRAT